MSILLDALKKSERRQGLGSVPGLHSQDSIPPGSEQSGPGLTTWLLAAAVFLLLAWLSWNQFAPGVPGSEQSGAVDAEAVKQGPAIAEPPREQAPPETVNAEEVAGSLRTPMESLPETEPADEPEPGPDPGSTAVLEDQAPPAGPALEAAPQQASKPSQQSQGPRPISYWELPSNIRDELPELKITVLVYSERPEDRFVLLNGKRRVEGDEVFQDLKMVKVERDGAVFTYRKYRFFVRQ